MDARTKDRVEWSSRVGAVPGADRERSVAATRRRIGAELGPMRRLAVPVVVAELGWMAMAIVDMKIVGRLEVGAVGVVGLAGNLYIAVVIFGIGLLLGLDATIARDHGAGRPEAARASLAQGIYLALGLTPIAWAAIRLMIPLLPGLGIRGDVLDRTIPLLEALSWSAGPLLIFTALRRYLQAVDIVGPITFALVTANLVNAVACWALVYGKLGCPRLGITGSGWATGLARLYLMFVLVVTFWVRGRGDRRSRVGPSWSIPRFDAGRFAELIRLGWPAALQLGLEVGVFAAATTLAGGLDKVSQDAHQIVLSVSSLTFMVPLGVAAAGAVRVGQALGRCDHLGAATSGWTALLLGAGFMTASGLTLLVLARPIVGAFSDDPAVLATCLRLFLLAAAFQLFDGIQVVATGVLRGAGDTRTPMLSNLVAHWGIGLPTGYALAFGLGWGIVGLWVGLSLGLVLAGLANLATWAHRARHLDRIDPVALGSPGHS